MAHDHPLRPQPLRPSSRDRTWPIDYEPDASGPDVQLRLRWVDGRTYLTIDGAHGVVFAGLHLTKVAARSLRHALDDAIAAWEQLEAPPALLGGYPAPHREEESL